jgi:uncharacterized lipoprotein YmbA
MKPLIPLFVATMVVACSPQPPVQPAQTPAPTVASAAAAELAQCMVDDPIAQRTRMNALEKAGDKVGAQAVRLLLARPVRNAAYLLVHTKLPAAAAPATPSKGGKPAGP